MALSRHYLPSVFPRTPPTGHAAHLCNDRDFSVSTLRFVLLLRSFPVGLHSFCIWSLTPSNPQDIRYKESTSSILSLFDTYPYICLFASTIPSFEPRLSYPLHLHLYRTHSGTFPTTSLFLGYSPSVTLPGSFSLPPCSRSYWTCLGLSYPIHSLPSSSFGAFTLPRF